MKFFLPLFFLFPLLLPVQEIQIKSGDTIIFFGDSITAQASRKEGFISIIQDSLKQRYDSLTIINAGISGNKVTDLQKRVEKDVLAKKPNLVVIYIGINDVWHHILPGLHGTPKEEFEQLLRSIIVEIQKSEAQVLLCTPSVVGEKPDGTNRLDGELDAYAHIGRGIAKSLDIPFCDLRKAFIDYLKANNSAKSESGILTYDKVHLSDAGNRLVASELQKFFVK